MCLGRRLADIGRARYEMPGRDRLAMRGSDATEIRRAHATRSKNVVHSKRTGLFIHAICRKENRHQGDTCWSRECACSRFSQVL
jgi:hypothetical protein